MCLFCNRNSIDIQIDRKKKVATLTCTGGGYCYVRCEKVVGRLAQPADVYHDWCDEVILINQPDSNITEKAEKAENTEKTKAEKAKAAEAAEAEVKEKIYFAFLLALRDNGGVNMMEGPKWLGLRFSELFDQPDKASDIFCKWTKSFQA